MEFRQLFPDEQLKVIPLLGKCFPVWQKHLADREYPFETTSFAALDGERIVAHCSVVKLDISDGAGRQVQIGGLASVATDPDYRHRGLAETLCRLAIDYAKREKLAALPLFTSFPRVYEKNNWRDYPIFMPKLARWKTAKTSTAWRSGAELSEAEKARIISLYDAGFDFPGKVRRVEGSSRSVFGWQRRFTQDNWVLTSNFYASGADNLVDEINGDPEDPAAAEFLRALPQKDGATVFALPETSPFWRLIAEYAELAPAEIFFHGPMVLDLSEEKFFQNHLDIYFPLADRF